MNQILSTETNRNNNKGGKKDIKSVARFFAISIFLFGIILIATSSFALYKNGNNKEQERIKAIKPTIQLDINEEGKLLITIMHDEVPIDNVVYYWNDGNKTTIDGDGRKYIQKTVEIPSGKNTLYIAATDINGNVTDYKRDYEIAGDIKIDIKQSGNNVKITVTSKNDLKYIKYNWDEEEAKTIEVKEKIYALEVEASIGIHTLTVNAEDSQGNKQQLVQKVSGRTSPTLKVEKGDNCYVITAHDDVALQKIEIVTLEDGKVTTIESDGKDFTYKFPLKTNNDNFIKITAYNTQGVASKVIGVKWTK